jgi:hypothetical protein
VRSKKFYRERDGKLDTHVVVDDTGAGKASFGVQAHLAKLGAVGFNGTMPANFRKLKRSKEGQEEARRRHEHERLAKRARKEAAKRRKPDEPRSSIILISKG